MEATDPSVVPETQQTIEELDEEVLRAKDKSKSPPPSSPRRLFAEGSLHS